MDDSIGRAYAHLRAVIEGQTREWLSPLFDEMRGLPKTWRRVQDLFTAGDLTKIPPEVSTTTLWRASFSVPENMMYFYLKGEQVGTWNVSTGETDL